MTSDTAPSGQAVYFDGTSNRKRRVALRMASGLDILEDGALVETWPYDRIRRADGAHALLRLACVSALPLARLEIEDAATAQALIPHCASLDVGRGGSQTWRIVFWSAAAVCSIVAVVLYGIPFAADRLAPLVPLPVENRIGEAVDKQIRVMLGGKVCDGAAGRAAFAKLMDKVRQAAGIETPLDAHVLSSSVPNAFALPGGRVYLLDGLLQKARNADEVAGVIAHELGHVHHRDNLRKIIQEGGTSFLVGLLLGDVIGATAVIFAARSVLDASYSREAEQRADAFAVETMHKLGRSAAPMGELLVRLTAGDPSKYLTIIASHPLSEDRLVAMTKEDRPITGPEILSAPEWRALKDICKGSRAAGAAGAAPDASGNNL
jgi:Zn-dependent protease with chaperone function